MNPTDVFPTGTTYEIDAKTTLDNDDVIRTITTFVFDGCTLNEVLAWASADRRIAVQRAVRGCKTDVARDHMNGNVLAKTAGHKPVSVDELIERIPPDVRAEIARRERERMENDE